MNKIKGIIEEFDDSVITINVKATETYKSLQRRTDKAIDYIEKHSNKTSEYLDVWEVKELLEILKGSNND